MQFDPKEIGLKVGLEIHQQLGTSSKLFCECPVLKSDYLPYSFRRRLRPAQSEVGRVDPAAVFEFAKGKPITLLNGSELLYLLEKHGHKARIDLAEARLLAAEREKAEGKGASG
jgi:Glu-tRNA(Gln) amidotransferase subunit E-like FAD-binding protein